MITSPSKYATKTSDEVDPTLLLVVEEELEDIMTEEGPPEDVKLFPRPRSGLVNAGDDDNGNIN